VDTLWARRARSCVAEHARATDEARAATRLGRRDSNPSEALHVRLMAARVPRGPVKVTRRSRHRNALARLPRESGRGRRLDHSSETRMSRIHFGTALEQALNAELAAKTRR